MFKKFKGCSGVEIGNREESVTPVLVGGYLIEREKEVWEVWEVWEEEEIFFTFNFTARRE
ncbi:hypothetical protein BC008_37280 [Mastigocoleus testarum BC008]|uniref:Uncharacterized protein n=1 Tax=Mastigocoleus testarum BC008 TaxID=371196 RepID=A0A0V7ZC84_9CYAN|nr:hypothetical protein BC008_37280 [Mastigocoleus testarum BC008]